MSNKIVLLFKEIRSKQQHHCVWVGAHFVLTGAPLEECVDEFTGLSGSIWDESLSTICVWYLET